MEQIIDTLLNEKINEIFLNMQERFNIKCGDVEPLDEYELNEMRIQMSVLIGKMVRKQMR